MSESPSFSASVKQGLLAARQNIVYGLALQVLALSLVLGYYFYPPIRSSLIALSEFRSHTGLLFGIVSTGLCGGLIPFILLRLFARKQVAQSWAMGLLVTIFWAYKGLEVEVWYRILGAVFGNAPEVETVVYKTLCDQFIYCPLVAIPLSVLVYSWGQYGFSVSRTWQDIRTPGWYTRRVFTPLLSNLGIWLPACVIIYSLPTSLQLPLQNLVLVFFTLILSHLTCKRQPMPQP